jgi:hypothetical protein
MVRQFILATKENEMVVIDLGYKSYVMSIKDAVALAEILEKAELYESKWVPTEQRGNGPDNTHHVYENDVLVNMKIISDDLYRMAKLAGRPEKK